MITRRHFVRSMTVALPVVAMPACEDGAEQAVAGTLDAGVLRALADVLLPSELGGAGLDAATAGFQAWVAAYRPAAEAEHGYGTDEITYTSPHPGPGWAAQLEALDLESRQRFTVGFAALDTSRRAGLARAMLTRERATAFPPPAEAHTVALGFLAWYYATPGASDLCHGADIGARTCRPLDRLPEKPVARAPGV